MEKDKVLNVGDVIYCDPHFGNVVRKVIDKVTNTLAFVGHQKFQRRTHGDYVHPVPKETGWTSNSYWIETPTIREKYQRQQLFSLIENKLRDDKKITTETLVAIAALLAE